MQRSYESELLDKVFDDLFPITRSITGPGIEYSLEYLQRHIPLNIEKVPSGTEVFDWTVPDEWHFKRARLWGPNDELICDTKNSNLHVLNYSHPIDKVIDFSELDKHLFSLEKLPEAIPYVTSYYQRTWGICITHSKRKKLLKGNYRVKIESEFKKDGGVPFGHCTLQGESEKEILITSYICHPSMANNELSGPLVLLALYNRIKKWQKRRYTYRFLLNPETIGSLCFLHKHQEHLREKLHYGLVLTCLGGPSDTLRYKASRSGCSSLDILMSHIAANESSWNYGEFTPLGGSDERQYCSPGFNFPMGQVARTIYGQYDEYHNSLDNKEFMDLNKLLSSIESIEKILTLGEVASYPTNLAPYGEPQLGKRGLYPHINAGSRWPSISTLFKDKRWQLDVILTILSMADGKTHTTDIAAKLNCSVADLAPTLEKLEKNQLLKL